MPHAIDDGETGCRRRSLAREIRDDGEMLSAVIGLLTRARALADWPVEAAGALEGALWPDHGNSHEFEKARRLRRHLFVDLPPPSFPSRRADPRPMVRPDPRGPPRPRPVRDRIEPPRRVIVMRGAGGHEQVDIEAAIGVILDLVSEHRRTTGRPLTSIVLVGGTALAAHMVRTLSEDVDLYASDVDDEVLDRVAKRHAGRFGPRFKIDATPSNTLWGAIALADIERSPGDQVPRRYRNPSLVDRYPLHREGGGEQGQGPG